MTSLENYKKEIGKVLISFEESFLNYNFEVILFKKSNRFFITSNIKNAKELKCKVLEWACATSYVYKKEAYLMRIGVNRFLGTNFSKEDIYKIAYHISCGCNRNLTMKFIDSGYNLKIFDKC